MKLYDHPVSGNGYKVRLFLALAGLAAERITVDVAVRAHKASDFLVLNPRGQIPVLVDGETVLFDSQAILVYLAARHAPDWLPTDPRGLGEVTQWLAFAAKEIAVGLQAARLHFLIGTPIDIVAAQAEARRALAILETWLSARDWLVGTRPTVADIACFPYVALAPEARVALDPYAAVGRWIARIRALPAFEPML
ncbi:glutathione S-transferase family protein [Prosthecodimorpha staleyi]|uniref:Glutathione S-transferase N-terminal domain-containing protein n=1 Tax=Prosthecodimorpha staleyi TaxID=2840188 RepID=A0A947D8X3_9HYPH|nr:glutathione S-transferase N-terminal domain-containing protein [Prosthecodimorpha staleyi]MBT9290197.1 glutathione S-transferase N-terminal domain-containing protein [Prosthecodimorpha staleyi]